jgi:c(7)-type cytochrome triheme protein
MNQAGQRRHGVRIRGGLFVLLGLLLLVPPLVLAARFWDLPKALPPPQFGDLLLDRVSSANQVKSVYFSHWRHRVRYTCRVCHWELDFAFQAGQTEITETDNRNGLYCGACHNGRVAFGHDQANCERCHTGQLRPDLEKFDELRASLPKNTFGNQINWAAAARSGRIDPVYSLYRPGEQPLDFRKRLELKAEWQYVPPAFFPHDIHARWLDCANCHPDIFNIKKKGTAHFLMQYILEERFCGVCHLRVAFPMDDCHRCHPGIKNE